MPLEVGQKAPPFKLLNQSFEPVSLENLLESKAVVVFIPFAFTGTCEGELCEIRDNFGMFEEAGYSLVAITCDTLHSNRVWSEQNGFQFDILSDFWPHGRTAQAYDSFDETIGYAKRTTYFLDTDGVIERVVASDELGVARPFSEYKAALQT